MFVWQCKLRMTCNVTIAKSDAKVFITYTTTTFVSMYVQAKAAHGHIDFELFPMMCPCSISSRPAPGRATGGVSSQAPCADQGGVVEADAAERGSAPGAANVPQRRHQ